MLRYVLASWALLVALDGCGHAKPKPVPVDPPQDVVDAWHAAGSRLLQGFLDAGFVVSRDGAAPIHQGDSLIFTGIALSALPCSDGAPLDAALQQMVKDLRGGLYRHPSLASEISLDGALGFYLGVAHRVKRCAEADTWRPLLATHKDAAPFLNRASGVQLQEPFTYVRDKLLAAVDLGDEPDPRRLAALEKAAIALGEAPHLARIAKTGSDACFRPHLGLLAFQAVEALGGQISASGRDSFCAVTAQYDLPTIDQWCGRDGLAQFTSSYQPNQWQYRHQRCPAWEAPDGNGKAHPGVDFLRGLADQYRLVF
jgi:hypothetical protein